MKSHDGIASDERRHGGFPFSRRTFLHLSVGAAASMLTLQGCTRGGPSGSAPSPTHALQEGVALPADLLRIAFAGAPSQLDPAVMNTIEAYQAAYMVYDSLVWVDRDLQPQPMLATGWESSADGLRWDFSLRPDVVFHHGTPFSAGDVVHTLTRLIDPTSGSRLASSLGFIDAVEALDEQTVRLKLNAPNMDLLLLLGTVQARILAADYSQQQLNTQPSGTGPYRVTEIVPGHRIRFQRNAEYWDGARVLIGEVEHHYVPSLDLQVVGLVQGEIDLIPDVGSTFPDLLADTPDIELFEVTSGAYQTVVMQATAPPFDDVRVRRALKYCVDRDALRTRIMSGRGETGNDHPVSSVSPFWADLPLRTRDITRARALLAEAGYADGFEIDLITSTSRPGMVELAQAVQEMVAPAGVKVNVVLVPADIYWSDYGGKVPFHIGNWGFRPSIDETFHLAYHSTASGNESRWSDPQLDEWIDTARGEQDPDARTQLYAQAQELIMEDGAVIVPYFRPIVSAAHTRVQGYQPHPAGLVDIRDVTLRVPSAGTRNSAI